MPKHNRDIAALLSDTEAAIAAAPSTGEWAQALSLVASITGGWGCHLNRMSADESLTYSICGGISQDIIREFARNQGASPDVNMRAAAIYKSSHWHVGSEADFTTKSEWESSGFCQNFLSKVDAEYSLFGKMAGSGESASCITVLRSKKQGHASALEKKVMAGLLPKIAAAQKLQELIDKKSLSFAAHSFDAINAPVFICGPTLKVHVASQAAFELAHQRDFVMIKDGRLQLKSPKMHQSLVAAVMKNCDFHAKDKSCCEISVYDPSGKKHRTVTVAPTDVQGEGPFYFGSVLLFFSEERLIHGGAHSILRLTQAEIEIGQMLLDGATTREISNYRGVSTSTVQTQIKRLGDKLNARHRAALLVALQSYFRH